MKYILLVATLFASLAATSQSQQAVYYKKLFEAKYMEKPPVFSFGRDSLRHFYFNHFSSFDTVINQAVEKGDTAKYIRIYFSFNLDEYGYAYEPKFERVASSRSAVTESAKTIKYFFDMKDVLEKAISNMLKKMPAWRPGLENGVPVNTINTDYLQFWVGLSAPI
jgi:hypothetical protein